MTVVSSQWTSSKLLTLLHDGPADTVVLARRMSRTVKSIYPSLTALCHHQYIGRSEGTTPVTWSITEKGRIRLRLSTQDRYVTHERVAREMMAHERVTSAVVIPREETIREIIKIVG